MIIVSANPILPGEHPGAMELQLFVVAFLFNLAINSTILAASLKAMGFNLNMRFIAAVLVLTLGGFPIDSIAYRVSSNTTTLYIVALVLIASYTTLIVKVTYRSTLKKAIAAGITVGLISNPAIFAI